MGAKFSYITSYLDNCKDVQICRITTKSFSFLRKIFKKFDLLDSATEHCKSRSDNPNRSRFMFAQIKPATKISVKNVIEI